MMDAKLKNFDNNFVDQAHDYGIYLPTKTIIMEGDVDEDFAKKHMANIHILDSFEGTINIKLFSGGGDVNVARIIYSAIKGCKNFVRITCYGEVASAATIILQAADERVATPESKLMVHVGAEGFAMNHPKNIDSAYRNAREDASWMEDVYLSQIKQKKKRFTRHQLQDLIVFDSYLNAKQALDLGLIDLIGEVQ